MGFYISICTSISAYAYSFDYSDSLVELERPTAYHTTPIFPPHNLRSFIDMK